MWLKLLGCYANLILLCARVVKANIIAMMMNEHRCAMTNPRGTMNVGVLYNPAVCQYSMLEKGANCPMWKRRGLLFVLAKQALHHDFLLRCCF